MKYYKNYILILGIIFSLTGCGVKGDLYLDSDNQRQLSD